MSGMPEGKKNRGARSAGEPAAERSTGAWGVSFSDLFKPSLESTQRIFRDIQNKVDRFVEIKTPNPLSNLAGKHDRPCTGALTGLWHTHLRDDAVLLYKLKNRCVHMICVVPHADIEGKRLKQTRQNLIRAGELEEATAGLAERITESVLRGCGLLSRR